MIEEDRGGQTVQERVGKLEMRDRVRLISLGEHKDPSGLYLHDPVNFKTNWEIALLQAQPWTEPSLNATQQTREELFAHCKDIAEDPQILDPVFGGGSSLWFGGGKHVSPNFFI